MMTMMMLLLMMMMTQLFECESAHHLGTCDWYIVGDVDMNRPRAHHSWNAVSSGCVVSGALAICSVVIDIHSR